MEIPRVGPLGVRETVNVGLTDDEKIWHFRSAWNVAALNCLDPQHQPILDGYSAYIKDNARDLRSVNERLDAKYRETYSVRREAIQARELEMTSVYNFFALPPVRAGLCQTALDISNRALATPDLDPAAFALANFALFEQPYETFFDRYEAYERESAAWDARYGARYGASQPGYVAVQQARNSIVPMVGTGDPVATLANPEVVTTTTTVVDPDTGAPVPVIPVDPTRESVPIVQPIPTDAGENDTPQQQAQE